MTLDLYVDGPRWRAHLRATADANPGLVPVAKGNGYGFGLSNLARRTAWLRCDTIAVGTYREVAEVIQRCDADVLVLEPWRPFTPGVPYGRRVIHTVGRLPDLAALSARDDTPRVVLEALTSMRRHGFCADDLRAAALAARGVRVEGHALHLPLPAARSDGDAAAEIEGWLAASAAPRWFLSHAGSAEFEQVRRAHPGVELRPRIGTALWLGDPGALSARATVLDAHRVRRGERVGYRQRRIRRDGVLLVASGGTAHGIGLESPTAAATTRQRAISVARGSLDAAGWSLSPYTVAGRQRWFVEPPHMQVSLIFVPDGVRVPAVGEQLEVRVRMTTTTFDAIHLS